MIRLKNKYEGKAALVIMGGPSILANNIKLGLINKNKYTIFLETKALTPKFLDFGLEPDFYLMSFSEKSKDNSLQHYIFRSFLAQFKIRSFLKPEYSYLVEDMSKNFDIYFEPWRIVKGPHKRYRWKPDVYLKDSPYDLLRNLPRTKIIAEKESLKHYFPNFKYDNELYFFEQGRDSETFSIDRYYHPIAQDDKIILRDNKFLNSTAIALYPLLYFMGFREVYLLGMDMSMLGAMEYAVLYTFKSMLHFWWFFSRTKHVFNANYKSNFPFYFRPKSEFEDLRSILDYKKVKFIRIYDKFKFAAPIKFINTITFADFLNRQNETLT